MKIKKIFIFIVIATVFSVGIFTIYAMEQEKLTKNIKLPKSNTVTVKYFSKEKFEGKALQIYNDNNKNQYLFLDNELVGYLKKTDITSQKSISKLNLETKNNKIENYNKIAEEIAKEIINEKKTTFEDYQLVSKNYIESYGEFSYTYSKFIDGFTTTDSITISLDNNGNLSSFIANRQGIFNEYSDTKIDREKVNQFIIEEMEKNYYNIENYTVQNQFITFINNKPTLEIQIELEHSINELSLISLYYYL